MKKLIFTGDDGGGKWPIKAEFQPVIIVKGSSLSAPFGLPLPLSRFSPFSNLNFIRPLLPPPLPINVEINISPRSTFPFMDKIFESPPYSYAHRVWERESAAAALDHPYSCIFHAVYSLYICACTPVGSITIFRVHCTFFGPTIIFLQSQCV